MKEDKGPLTASEINTIQPHRNEAPIKATIDYRPSFFHGSALSLREAHKLWIPRSPIRTNAICLESALHVHSSRLVKAHASLLHDLQDLALGRAIEPRAAVAVGYIARQVKVGRRKARLDVVGEGAAIAAAAAEGQTAVEVVGTGDADVVGEEMLPAAAGEVESRH